MSWMDNVKNFLGSNGRTEEDDFEDETEEFEEEEAVEEEAVEETEEVEPKAAPKASRFELPRFGTKQAHAPAPKPIIDFEQNQGGKIAMDTFTEERSQILLYKPTSLDGIKKIADRVNQKKTVILNLEDQDEDFIKTVIDFFSGVAYANHGKLSPIADKTYIVTPDNVDMGKPEGANIGDSELGSLNILDALNNDTF